MDRGAQGQTTHWRATVYVASESDVTEQLSTVGHSIIKIIYKILYLFHIYMTVFIYH